MIKKSRSESMLARTVYCVVGDCSAAKPSARTPTTALKPSANKSMQGGAFKQPATVRYQQRFRLTEFFWAFCCYLVL